MRFNTNHDKNVSDGPPVDEYTPEGAKATAVLVFTYPGVPLIYNGEEVGNNNKLNLFEKIDINWSKREDFRELYKSLSVLRCDHPALRRGSYITIQDSNNIKVCSFVRTKGKDTVLVVINFGAEEAKINMKLPQSSSVRWKDTFSGRIIQSKSGNLELFLPQLGYAVFIPE
jgi:glycosidase